MDPFQHLLSLLLLFLLFLSHCASAQQQSYASTYIAGDCQSSDPLNLGYLCSTVSPTCQTYAYYRPDGGQTLDGVALLFNTSSSAIATASGISSSSSSLTAQQPLFVPLDCSCAGRGFSQSNTTYSIQSQDSFSKIANSTYQGLTTCSAVQAANPSLDATSLSLGQPVLIPLRCACPSGSLLSQGIKLLVSYPVIRTNNPYTLSVAFGADLSILQSTNNLSQNSVIYPQTSLLIPLKDKPSSPPLIEEEAPAPQPPPSVVPGSRKNSHVGLYAGIASSVVVVLALVGLAAFFLRRRARRTHDAVAVSEGALLQSSGTGGNTNLSKDYMLEIAEIDNKLVRYSAEDISEATNGFDESNRIKGSVYRGVLKGQVVAIKRIHKDISKEVSLSQRTHHAKLVPLLGVCIRPLQSFIVSPYYEKGSLSDWLHDIAAKKGQFEHEDATFLSWCSRLRIAADIADVLEYLHDYTKPGFVHKNIKSSNILLDSNFRGKLANFVLATTMENMTHGPILTSNIVGTPGYMAPEYVHHGLISSKLDVFAFGVVLLEIISGEEAILRDDEGMQLKGERLWESMSRVLDGEKVEEQLVSWMDCKLRDQYPLDCAMKLAWLAKRCIVEDPTLRPEMSTVASALRQVLEASEKWEKLGLNRTIEGR